MTEEDKRLKKEFDEGDRYLAEGIESGALNLFKIWIVIVVIWTIFLIIHFV